MFMCNMFHMFFSLIFLLQFNKNVKNLWHFVLLLCACDYDICVFKEKFMLFKNFNKKNFLAHFIYFLADL